MKAYQLQFGQLSIYWNPENVLTVFYDLIPDEIALAQTTLLRLDYLDKIELFEKVSIFLNVLLEKLGASELFNKPCLLDVLADTDDVQTKAILVVNLFLLLYEFVAMVLN